MKVKAQKKGRVQTLNETYDKQPKKKTKTDGEYFEDDELERKNDIGPYYRGRVTDIAIKEMNNYGFEDTQVVGEENMQLLVNIDSGVNSKGECYGRKVATYEEANSFYFNSNYNSISLGFLKTKSCQLEELESFLEDLQSGKMTPTTKMEHTIKHMLETAHFSKNVYKVPEEKNSQIGFNVTFKIKPYTKVELLNSQGELTAVDHFEIRQVLPQTIEKVGINYKINSLFPYLLNEQLCYKVVCSLIKVTFME